ncbi:MAG: glycoside hydrolase family 25 protein [Chlorobi bacterium]|nr:glycoside hydrolase family 25 protein [Chlorobiota bacterium]
MPRQTVKTKKRRSISKRNTKSKKKNKRLLRTFVIIISLLMLLFAFRFSIFREARSIYVKINHITFTTPIDEKSKIEKIFNKYDEYVFGTDFSHYQGIVNWARVDTFNNGKPVSFAIVRATMGHSGKDIYFKYNWKKLKSRKIIRGAYHYYRPNENSLKQAGNFIKRVKLESGDLPPILDIEDLPKIQSVKNLCIGLKRWLDTVEKHYNVKPILYTNDHYFKTYLSKKEFKDYILWIANYSEVKKPKTSKWKIWQFTEKGNLNGVDGFVDFNVFRGNIEELNEILIK